MKSPQINIPKLADMQEKHHGWEVPARSLSGNGDIGKVAQSVAHVENPSEGPDKTVRNGVTPATRKRRCCPHGPAAWCKKYWWEGQDLKKQPVEDLAKRLEGKSWSQRLLIKHRRIVGFCIPAVFFHFFWWAYFIEHKSWHLFPDKYLMTITMVFGSLIAGMTSEGGGAVAFPVMTLALSISPSIARDFTLMIQSCGMSAASFTIFFMGVRVERNSLLWCSLGAVGGIIFGFHVVDPSLSPSVKKLGFVSIWFAFASVLIIINRTAKRRLFKKIPDFNWWRLLVLVLAGFLGGIFTSFSGSGLDICSFMILTLLFRVSEKVATPTSVILMAVNSLVGFIWRGLIMEAITPDAFEYLAVCIPVVVIGAPVGSVLGSHFHRLVLASLVILLDTVAIATAFAIIRPLPPALVGGCCAVIVGCFAIFMGITYAGQRLLDAYERREHLSPDRSGDNQDGNSREIGSGEVQDRPSSDADYNSGECQRQDSNKQGHVNQAFTSDLTRL